MSSGLNRIPIRRVGKLRYRLAELLSQATGGLVEAHEIERTNPVNQHYEDCCAWDCYATMPAKGGCPAYQIHLYSWDTMKSCVKHGVVLLDGEPRDRQVCSNT